jgi:hypothetical protein
MNRSPFFLVLVALTSGCAVQQRETGALFDQLRGRGPLIIDAANETGPSTRFFRDNWQGSTAIKQLVSTRGAPDALSVEREFLQPNRLKLFYPSQGEVFILDSVDGEWFVAGIESVQDEDLKVLQDQRAQKALRDPKTPS